MAKAKIGRPPLGKNTTLVTFKLPEADARRWRVAARKSGMTLSDLIRAAVEGFIK